MCGIYGYLGTEILLSEYLIKKLKQLEYRGYDSWGVAIGGTNSVVIDKNIGNVPETCLIKLTSKIGIGHTRWATHGGVEVSNAHPFVSCNGNWALVHNGMVENHLQLKKNLKNTHKIYSQTDSEIFLHLLEEISPRLSIQSIKQAFTLTKGLSAFLLMECKKQQLFVVKNGSPIIIGMGEKQISVSSDIKAFDQNIKKIVVMEDQQIAQITKKGVQISQLDNLKKVVPKMVAFHYQPEKQEKKDFAHFMLKEIHEQPLLIRKQILQNIDQLRMLKQQMISFKKIYFVGAGSSFFVAQLSSCLLGQIAKIDSQAVMASEFNQFLPFLNSDSVVIFFSQSGETIDLIDLIDSIKQQEATILAVVNNQHSTLSRLADCSFWINAGVEVSVASTKAVTMMASYFLLISFMMVGQPRKGEKLLARELKQLDEILSPNFIKRYIPSVVNQLMKIETGFILGKGSSLIAAREFALKIKEVGYLHLEAIASGELKHGVIALVNQNSVVTILDNPEHRPDLLSAALQVRARGAQVIWIGEKIADQKFLTIEFKLTETSFLQLIIVVQLISYFLSVKKGINPDRPKNLAKSVTVR